MMFVNRQMFGLMDLKESLKSGDFKMRDSGIDLNCEDWDVRNQGYPFTETIPGSNNTKESWLVYCTRLVCAC